jgi:hypothetical protein
MSISYIVQKLKHIIMIIKNTPPHPFTTPESFRECKTYLEQQGMPKYPFTSHQEQTWWFDKAWELGLGDIVNDI